MSLLLMQRCARLEPAPAHGVPGAVTSKGIDAGREASGPTADDKFVTLAGNYLDRMLAFNPEWATNLGDHRFDGDHQSGPQAEVASSPQLAADEVGHLRVFVHLAADSVPHERLDHGELGVADIGLHLRGHFAPEFEYEEWASEWRSSLHGSYLHLAHATALALVEAGRYVETIDALARPADA